MTFVLVCIIIFLCCITSSLFLDARSLNHRFDTQYARMRELEKTLLQIDNDLGVQRSDNEDLVSENRRLRRELTRSQRAHEQKNIWMEIGGVRNAYLTRNKPKAPKEEAPQENT